MFSAKVQEEQDLGSVIHLIYENPDTPEKNLQVSIAPKLGSNMFQFKVGDNDVIYCDKKLLVDGDWTGNFVLWPLPNRVSGKQYEFEEQTISLQDIKRKRGNEPLIHGLVDDQVWEYELPASDEVSASIATHIAITK